MAQENLTLDAQAEAVASILTYNARGVPSFRLRQLEAAEETLRKLVNLRERVFAPDAESDESSEAVSQDILAILGLPSS